MGYQMENLGTVIDESTLLAAAVDERARAFRLRLAIKAVLRALGMIAPISSQVEDQAQCAHHHRVGMLKAPGDSVVHAFEARCRQLVEVAVPARACSRRAVFQHPERSRHVPAR
jgi:hypothetical protein